MFTLRKSLRVGMAGLLVSVTAGIGALASSNGVAFADGVTTGDALDSFVDPFDSGVIHTVGGLSIDAGEVLGESGAAETFGTICVAGAVETAGASCIAATAAAAVAVGIGTLAFHISGASAQGQNLGCLYNGCAYTISGSGYTVSSSPVTYDTTYGGVWDAHFEISPATPYNGSMTVWAIGSDGGACGYSVLNAGDSSSQSPVMTYNNPAGTAITPDSPDDTPQLPSQWGAQCGANNPPSKILFTVYNSNDRPTKQIGLVPAQAGQSNGASAPTASGNCSDGSSANTLFDATSSLMNVTCPPGTFLDKLQVSQTGTTNGTDTTTWNPPTDWCTQTVGECDGQDSPGKTLYPLCAPNAADFPCNLIWQVKNPNFDTTDSDSKQWIDCAENDADCSLLPANDPGTSTTQKTLTITGTDTLIGSPTYNQQITSEFRVAFGPYTVPWHDGYTGKASPTPGTPGTEAPAPTSSGTDSCFPSGFAQIVNPIDWVEKPVKCALSWAFEPSTSIATQWDDFTNEVDQKPPVSLIVGGLPYVTGAVNSNTQDGGCELPNGDPCNVPFQDPTNIQTSAHQVDFVGTVGNMMQSNPFGHAFYVLCKIALIVGFMWAIWTRISASFGSKSA